MYRICPLVLKASHVVLRRNPVQIEVAYLSRSAAHFKYKKFHDKDRETCPPCPPPDIKPKEDYLFWGTIAVLLLTGSFAVVAKNSPEIRDWLTLQVPWFDDLLAVLRQENVPLTVSIRDACNAVVAYIMSKLDDEECDEHDGPSLYDDDDDDDEDDVEDIDEELEICPIVPPPVISKDVCEIEKYLMELTDIVYHNYMTARDACICYNQVVADNMAGFEYKEFRTLPKEKQIKDDLVKKHVDEAVAKNALLTDFRRYIECGVDVDTKRLEFSKKLLQDSKDKIDRMRIDFQIEHNKSRYRDAQWKYVEIMINTVVMQHMCAYPELDYDKDDPEIKGNLDIALLLAKKYMEWLKPAVLEAMPMMTTKANGAYAVLDMPQNEKERELNRAYSRAKQDWANDYVKWERILQDKLEAKRKKELEDLVKRHELGAEKRLAEMRAKDDATFDKRVAAKVAVQKHIFDGDLAEMAAKLEIVEDKLNQRLKAERETKRAQELYAAAASLLHATMKGSPIVKVDRELAAIKKNAIEEDKLVNTVLKAIPTNVWYEGVVPESVLRDRYRSMEEVALKVAMLEGEGGPLFLYAMSWIQSMLLFMKLSTIPQKEIDHPLEEPFVGLDTFDLLQRARYFVEQGNMAKALRYVDSLEGASRGAADAWFKAASAHVQTRQAAEAILAHAAAMNVRYL